MLLFNFMTFMVMKKLVTINVYVVFSFSPFVNANF